MSFRLLAELVPVLLALIVALLLRVPPRSLTIPTRVLRACSSRPVVASFVLTLLISACLSWVRTPRPAVHDEFSYLMAADTFAHGRLSNPTHPMWRHFEALHTFHVPTYQSKYPPGQALFLAAGQAITGHPITGAWLSMASAAAALCWMLLAWMPSRWALFGALLPAIRFGTLPIWEDNYFVYWSTTFWGGAVATLGGALLFGALVRVVRAPSPRYAAAFACGLLVLANTRPYEGFVAALPACGALAITMVKDWRGWRRWLRCAPAFVTVFVIGSAAMGYYNFRVTGRASTFPYILYSRQYDVTPLFNFQPRLPDKDFRHATMRDTQYGFMVASYLDRRAHPWPREYDIALVSSFFWGYALLVPLPWLLIRPLDRWALLGFFLIVLSLFANALTSTSILHPHYLGPVTAWLVYLPVAGMRRMRAWHWRRRRVGRVVAETVMAVCVFALVLGCARRIADPQELRSVAAYRPEMIAQLQQAGGKHLVIVEYAPGHPFYDEWAYNGADLDDSSVIWARSMGPDENRRLVEHLAGRRVWRLYVDGVPPRLEPWQPRQRPVGRVR